MGLPVRGKVLSSLIATPSTKGSKRGQDFALSMSLKSAEIERPPMRGINFLVAQATPPTLLVKELNARRLQQQLSLQRELAG